MDAMVNRRLLVSGVVLAAVCGLAPAAYSQQQPGAGTTAMATITQTVTATTTAPATVTHATTACLVATPPAWKQAIAKGALAKFPGERTVTLATSTGPWSRFAVLTDGKRQRLVAVRRGSTSYRVIASYPAAAQSAAGFALAHFDGRFLVYLVETDADGEGRWKLYSYDTQHTAGPRLIGQQQDAQMPAGPFVVPQVSKGLATWIQPLRDGRKQVHVYNLVTRKDRIVRTSHAYRSFFVGSLLVWQEAPAPDAPTQLRAVVARTGAPAKLPPQVAAVRGTGEVVGDGKRWLWLAADYSGIYEWQPGWKSPVERVSGGEEVQWLGLAGDLLTYTDSVATFVVDLRSGARTQVTEEYGVANVDGDSIEVGSLPGGAKAAPLNEWAVDARRLPPLPHCA
ncbi:hypothetical protein [Streptacidiphilus sp. PAMC 29251]